MSVYLSVRSVCRPRYIYNTDQSLQYVRLYVCLCICLSGRCVGPGTSTTHRSVIAVCPSICMSVYLSVRSVCRPRYIYNTDQSLQYVRLYVCLCICLSGRCVGPGTSTTQISHCSMSVYMYVCVSVCQVGV